MSVAVSATRVPADNSSIFAEKLQHWGRIEGIFRPEAFMINNYFEKDKRTLEAGCGGGRLLLALQSLGFTDLSGFDYLPEFIEIARQRDESGTIDYQVMNAVSVDYPDNSFDQLMFMQQVLCFLPSGVDQQRAVAEAFRVLRPGGVVIACVLAERSRQQSCFHRTFRGYMSCLRTLTMSHRSTQFLPWMRFGKKRNYLALLDRGPYVYWFREAELADLFENAGFRVAGIGTNAQISAGRLAKSVAELQNAPFDGGLYLVCQKPAA